MGNVHVIGLKILLDWLSAHLKIANSITFSGQFSLPFSEMTKQIYISLELLDLLMHADCYCCNFPKYTGAVRMCSISDIKPNDILAHRQTFLSKRGSLEG